MYDWEGCTTGTIGLPNPNQRNVAKTWGFLRERFLALEGERITWMGQPSRQGSALFSVRIELWRSTPEAIPKVLMKVRLRYALSFAQKDRARFDGLGARRSNRLLFCQFVVSQPQKANPR